MAYVNRKPTPMPAAHSLTVGYANLGPCTDSADVPDADHKINPWTRFVAWLRDQRKRSADRRMEAVIRDIGHPGVLADYLSAAGRLDGAGNALD